MKKVWYRLNETTSDVADFGQFEDLSSLLMNLSSKWPSGLRSELVCSDLCAQIFIWADTKIWADKNENLNKQIWAQEKDLSRCQTWERILRSELVCSDLCAQIFIWEFSDYDVCLDSQIMCLFGSWNSDSDPVLRLRSCILPCSDCAQVQIIKSQTLRCLLRFVYLEH